MLPHSFYGSADAGHSTVSVSPPSFSNYEGPNLAAPTINHCKRGHVLSFKRDPPSNAYGPEGEATCDLCSRVFKYSVDGGHTCLPCKYDICAVCSAQSSKRHSLALDNYTEITKGACWCTILGHEDSLGFIRLIYL